MAKRKSIKPYVAIVVFGLLTFCSLAYAGFSGALKISTDASLIGKKWQVELANIQAAVSTDPAITISPKLDNSNMSILVDVDFQKPGVAYFIFDIVNRGSFPASINQVSLEGLSPEAQRFITAELTINGSEDDGCRDFSGVVSSDSNPLNYPDCNDAKLRIEPGQKRMAQVTLHYSQDASSGSASNYLIDEQIVINLDIVQAE